MSSLELAIWWTAAVAGLIGCGLCAGLETGVYSLNRVRLQVRHDSGDRRARMLHRLVGDRAAVLTTLLVGTNVATNVTTSAMGILLQARGLSDVQVIIADVVIVTPLLFVFAETLPKDLFASHADRLVYPFAPMVVWMRRIFTWIGLVPLITRTGDLLMRSLGAQEQAEVFHPRTQMQLLVREGVGRGLHSDEQQAIVERVLALGERKVGDVMKPWSQVSCVREDDAPSRIWQLVARTNHSRFPVVNGNGSVTGVLNALDVLEHDQSHCPPLNCLIQPARKLAHDTPLRTAISELQHEAEALAIVTRGGRSTGLVTMKDLIEPITGELTEW